MKKVVVGLLAMSVGFALLQMVVTALLLASATLLLFSFVTRPHQTMVFLTTVLMVGLATTRPGVFIVALAIVALAVVAADAWRKPQRRTYANDEPQELRRLDRDPPG